MLYWNTIKINDIVENLRQQGEEIDNEALSRISLLPHKHVLPHRCIIRSKSSTKSGACRPLFEQYRNQ
ncbi:MAG: hypothetical protein DRJ13_01990 [Bacteroidetes bacterium]|nr:MAG: hypothetical protein DRJ13_01990 [Bacteroidota bacterium]